ncbi:hypothetical protein [uncultured Desulfobacter sp.]
MSLLSFGLLCFSGMARRKV